MTTGIAVTQQTFPIERRVLSSWKEIGAFLRVTTRTAQRWERKLDLPVHRLETGRNARLIAYTDELTRWLESRDSEKRASVPVTDNQPISRDGFPWSGRSFWLRAGFLIVCAGLLFACGIWAYMWWTGPGPPNGWKIEGDRFITIDSEGQVCWETRLAGIRPDVYAPDGHLSPRGSVSGEYDGILHRDVDGDGTNEWLVNCFPQTLDEDRGRLVCLEADGRLRWEFRYGAPLTWKGRPVSSSYGGLIIRPVAAQGKRYILTTAVHAFWFPAQVALLDPATGRVLEEYWHPGGLFRCKIHDINKDGEPEVLLGGVNNPGEGLGHAALVVLSLPFSKAGARPLQEKTEWGISNNVKELAYILFPRPDTYNIVGFVPVPDTPAVVEGERLLVKLTKPGEGSLFYYLNFSLELVDCRISDGVSAAHQQLSTSGQLDHPWSEAEARSLCQIRSFPTAPDGNSPDVDRFWSFNANR